MKSLIFWSFRIIITFIPVLFSNLAAAYNFAHMGKKSFLDLLSDGQICFLACSIAASSIVNLLEAWLEERPTLFSAFVMFVLLITALMSIAFYFFFKGVFNTEDTGDMAKNIDTAECRHADDGSDIGTGGADKADIERWTRYRNKSVVTILVVVIVFSFIADVCLA